MPLLTDLNADGSIRIWFRAGGGSDMFAVMTRAALDGYEAIVCPVVGHIHAAIDRSISDCRYRTIWDEFMGGCGASANDVSQELFFENTSLTDILTGELGFRVSQKRQNWPD